MNLQPVSSNKSCGAYSYRRAQRGVGLIEVLIAVLVLSIGILGIAALQTRALADNGSSMNRSAATAATYSILEAMRLDRVNALAGAYNTAAALKTDNCPAAGATLATYQLNKWCSQQLASFLGNVSTTQGTINCTAAGVCTITIQFDEGKATGGSNQFQLTTTATI